MKFPNNSYEHCFKRLYIVDVLFYVDHEAEQVRPTNTKESAELSQDMVELRVQLLVRD